MKMRLLSFAFLAVGFLSCNSNSEEKQKPNVLIIYMDDLGYGDVSAYKQGTLETQNIDQLAKGGIKFTNGYATSATCSPSRYALLSGQYPWKNERAKILAGDAPMLFDSSRATMADMFKNNGYETAVVGKWHMGLGDGNIDWNKDISITPNDIGFDLSYIMAATNDRTPTVYVENRKVVGLEANDPLYVSYKENFEGEPTAISNPELMTKMKWHHGHNQSVHNGVPRIGYMKGGKSALWVDENMADDFLAKAKEFITTNNSEKTGKPFFMYYALHEPHVPRVPHERFVGKSGLGPRGDAILEADWCVGQIMEHLENEGLLENTLVVFSSDNGPVLNDGYFDQAVELIGDHTPGGKLRGGKYSLFEAGTKVPFIVYWKGKVKPAISDALVSQLDLAASFAALIGDDTKFDDSENYLDTFLGKTKEGRKEVILEATGRLALRSGDYAFIPANTGSAILKAVNIEIGNDPKARLYNVITDPSQQSSVGDEEPEKLQELMDVFNRITSGYATATKDVELK
ncbi:Arylsulfatase A [Spirosomataceae bacterium TFI 002]|nr:Arylsulfatase A [Spirosomataceae bacterium TFI 002]